MADATERKYALLADLNDNEVGVIIDELEDLPCDFCGQGWIRHPSLDDAGHGFNHTIPREGRDT